MNKDDFKRQQRERLEILVRLFNSMGEAEKARVRQAALDKAKADEAKKAKKAKGEKSSHGGK